MPSVSRAKQTAKLIFGIIEEKVKIDPDQPGVPFDSEGGVELKNVMFRYPSRQKFVLRNFNLKIEPN
jgi:ABC-type multidrug transport system fused ATPase/permease subunit